MAVTRTGSFKIGIREVSVLSQEFSAMLEWASQSDIAVIDLVNGAVEKIPQVLAQGLQVGSIDLPNRDHLISADGAARGNAVETCKKFMHDCADAFSKAGNQGPIIFWTMMIPENPGLSRKENYGYMLESYRQLNDTLSEVDGKIAIEGWPGPGCVISTPEGYRSILRDCMCDRVGVNYDPSHLMRMGIDPLRFLQDFAQRVYHMHGKDTAFLTENLYEYGHEVPSIFEKPISFGGFSWRYTIPGHGQMRWIEAFQILKNDGYTGAVSTELEDANFNLGDGVSEKLGLELSTQFLRGC